MHTCSRYRGFESRSFRKRLEIMYRRALLFVSCLIIVIFGLLASLIVKSNSNLSVYSSNQTQDYIVSRLLQKISHSSRVVELSSCCAGEKSSTILKASSIRAPRVWILSGDSYIDNTILSSLGHKKICFFSPQILAKCIYPSNINFSKCGFLKLTEEIYNILINHIDETKKEIFLTNYKYLIEDIEKTFAQQNNCDYVKHSVLLGKDLLSLMSDMSIECVLVLENAHDEISIKKMEEINSIMLNYNDIAFISPSNHQVKLQDYLKEQAYNIITYNLSKSNPLKEIQNLIESLELH